MIARGARALVIRKSADNNRQPSLLVMWSLSPTRTADGKLHLRQKAKRIQRPVMAWAGLA